MDKRQIKTRRAIYNAMVELMKKTPYEKIFVKDIIDAAEIGRSTFYAHFETKEELARAMCNDLFEHVFAEHVNACQTHNYSEKSLTLENKLAHIFYHLRDKQQYYIGIISCDEGKLFTRFFREYLDKNTELIVKHEPGEEVPIDFVKNHLAFALIGALNWWLKGKMQVPPEKVAHYFVVTTNPADLEFKILTDKPE